MPNMQVLKFYFPVKESAIAQLECLTVDTFTSLDTGRQRQENAALSKILSVNYCLTTYVYMHQDFHK